MVAILNLHKIILRQRESMHVSACDNPFAMYTVLFSGTATSPKIVKRGSLL